MFTYSTNLGGTITSTLNAAGGSALLDDEEEKVDEFLFFIKMNFLSIRQLSKPRKKILNYHHHGFFLLISLRKV